MVNVQRLVQIFGAERAEIHYKHLTNKNRGGFNNYKGNAFENFFAVYKIAFVLHLDRKDSETAISAQTTDFIDDLLIENSNSRKFFQVKDVQALSWTSGDHPLMEDCELQFQVGDHDQVQTECTIVVSRGDVYRLMLGSIPEKLDGKVGLLHFETAQTINALLQVNDKFKIAIKSICAIKNANIDKLEVVAKILLGVWDASSKTTVSISDLYRDCLKINPNYFMGTQQLIPPTVESILTSIPGFSFEIHNSYINWAYNSSDTGVISHPIGSREFLQWENDLVSANPATFEDLEPFLS
ncbi:MAG: hypothetical protein EOO04_01085 [Chitinophagaceae bacterium]|nr:MAG: hypothetical protein EOO04_01085 [Chitinophagaceae bacterium]